MKTALIGASGFIGSALLKELLNRGHKVTAIVRHPEKITLRHKNLRVARGDVLNFHDAPILLAGFDAVISAYNPGWKNTEAYENTINAYTSIIHAVKKVGIRRLLVVGGAGSLEDSPGIQLIDTGMFPAQLKPFVTGLRDVLALLNKENELEWSFLCPSINIETGARTGKFRLGKDQVIKDKQGVSKISLEDYAMAMIDELETPKYIRQRFTVGY